jgi:hypothetical protein
MNKRIWIYLVLLAFLFSGCAASAQTAVKNAPGDSQYSGTDKSLTIPVQPQVSNESGAGAPDTTSQAVQAEIKRLVIKNADLSIVVLDPGASMAFIQKMAEGMGGYVVASNLYKTRDDNGIETPAGKITIRVPAEKLTEAMGQIKGQVKDPNQDIKLENISGLDVTKEYTDSRSRLTSLQAKEEKLKEIMASTNKTEDTLNVFRELTATQQEIEVLKGQIKYYEESAAMSAINVALIASASVQPLAIGGWQPVGVARDALQALINALKFIGYGLIWLVIFCFPITLLLGIPVFFMWRGYRRWLKGRKPAQAIASKTPPEV